MDKTKTPLQKARDAEYHRQSRRVAGFHPKTRRTEEQKLKYNASRRAKRASEANKIQADSNITGPRIEEAYVATKSFNKYTICFTKSDINRRESASAAEVNSQAEQGNVLPLEVDEMEPDPTAWLDHLDDPVLADVPNETPDMYEFLNICLPTSRID